MVFFRGILRLKPHRGEWGHVHIWNNRRWIRETLNCPQWPHRGVEWRLHRLLLKEAATHGEMASDTTGPPLSSLTDHLPRPPSTPQHTPAEVSWLAGSSRSGNNLPLLIAQSPMEAAQLLFSHREPSSQVFSLSVLSAGTSQATYMKSIGHNLLAGI